MTRRLLGLAWIVVALSATAHAQDLAAQQQDFYLALQGGQYERADRVIAEVRRQRAADALIEMLARRALEQQHWDEAMAVPASSVSSNGRVAALFSRGLGAARAAWPGGVGPMAEIARRAAESLDRMAQAEGRQGRAELARVIVLAAIAAAQEERDELQVLLSHATDLDVGADGRDTSGLPPLPLPVPEIAGDLWLQVDRYEEAIAAYTTATERHPERGRSWLGLARASVKTGAARQATDAYRAFLERWTGADPDLPELAEAHAFVVR